MAHNISCNLNDLQDMCHNASYKAGWWHHPGSGYPYIPGDVQLLGDGKTKSWELLSKKTREMIIHYWPFVIACKFALIHSEISESVEAHRRGLEDDKLSHRLGMEVELSDALIRQFDIAGAMNHAGDLGVVDPSLHWMAIGQGFVEKMTFNETRPDHKISARMSTGGKAY